VAARFSKAGRRGAGSATVHCGRALSMRPFFFRLRCCRVRAGNLTQGAACQAGPESSQVATAPQLRRPVRVARSLPASGGHVDLGPEGRGARVCPVLRCAWPEFRIGTPPAPGTSNRRLGRNRISNLTIALRVAHGLWLGSKGYNVLVTIDRLEAWRATEPISTTGSPRAREMRPLFSTLRCTRGSVLCE